MPGAHVVASVKSFTGAGGRASQKRLRARVAAAFTCHVARQTAAAVRFTMDRPRGFRCGASRQGLPGGWSS